jgi:hypothetical protein
MVTRIFWRETKRGLNLVERNQHFETTLGAVQIDFAWGAPKDKFQVGISVGLDEWAVLARDLSLEDAKIALLRALTDGVVINNRWFDSRHDPESKRTRMVESRFGQLVRNHGAENVVFQLEKIVGLPGKRKVA